MLGNTRVKVVLLDNTTIINTSLGYHLLSFSSRRTEVKTWERLKGCFLLLHLLPIYSLWLETHSTIPKSQDIFFTLSSGAALYTYIC